MSESSCQGKFIAKFLSFKILQLLRYALFSSQRLSTSNLTSLMEPHRFEEALS